MEDINSAKNELAIRTYLSKIESINSEPAKSTRFTLLLQSLFGVKPDFIEEYIQGIEKYVTVREKDRILRGQADLLSGNLIIEFEKELTSKAKLTESEEQLRRYTACVWSQEVPGKRTNFVCLATDGRRFRAFTPIPLDAEKAFLEPEQVGLNLLEDLDAAKVEWSEFYFFLDRYILRKEVLRPTSDLIVKDFGPNSHAFRVSETLLLNAWARLHDHPDFAVLYEAWDKYLRIVYGSSLTDRELWVRHTYLATVAKLMVWSRFASSQKGLSEHDIISILEGTYFREQMGIDNFLEEDFFSWIAREEAHETALSLARPLLALLQNYNLRELSEDVMKSLYEGLVDPETRHDLGEYYTPDWLAHRIVRRLLEPRPEAAVLDPACGSGTFLYMTIHEKRRLMGDSAKTLWHIRATVVGMDIHPLACIVAKANYVLALGDLMVRRKRRFSIPIYLANSIRPPELETAREFWQKVECYETHIDGNPVHIPAVLIDDPDRCDQSIDAARDFAFHSKDREIDQVAFHKFLKTQHPGLVDEKDIADVLYSVAETLHRMIKSGRDTIWAFVLKNIYKPLFLKHAFDIIVGNPPWLAYRYLERSEYQRFVREQISKRYQLVKGRGELVTHLELGTLFLVRSAHLYLKSEGKIGFVLPKSIFSADQHDVLRRGQMRLLPLAAVELWDLESTTPVFNISSAVYFGQKGKLQMGETIPGKIVRGELLVRNATYEVADEALEFLPAKFELSTMGTRSFWTAGEKVELLGSSYRRLFAQGATIVPRCFWFVDVQRSEFGYDSSLPPLISSERAQREAKKPYRDCVIQGPVEDDFLYTTLLPVDMIPFGYTRLRLVVLPILLRKGSVKLCDHSESRDAGFIHLADWIDQVNKEWSDRAGEKADRVTALEWLDYRRKMSQQMPTGGQRVVYAMSGTHVCACVVPVDQTRSPVQGNLSPRGFISDYKTYYLTTRVSQEACYLVGVLNAPFIDRLIKPMQSKGLWGARDICKKVLDLPIPIFDERSEQHIQLAKISAKAASRVKKWVASGGPGDTKSIGVLRRNVREILKKELAQIDSIVKPMLGL